MERDCRLETAPLGDDGDERAIVIVVRCADGWDSRSVSDVKRISVGDRQLAYVACEAACCAVATAFFDGFKHC